MKVRDWLLSASKYALSFRKREWELDDYPVRLVYHDSSAGPGTFNGWMASILKWWLIGTGPTKEAALQQLSDNLAAAKVAGNHPRPGTRPPMQFGPADRIGAHGDFAYEFVERVTGITPMFMSDATSLADFADGEEFEDVRRKVSLLFGLEAASIIEGPLWQVLDKAHPRAGAAEQCVGTGEQQLLVACSRLNAVLYGPF